MKIRFASNQVKNKEIIYQVFQLVLRPHYGWL